LAVASLSFDLSVYDLFGLLAVGGSIRVAGSEELRDPERLVRILVEEGITYWDSAPAALQQLVPFFPGPGEGGDRLSLVYLSGDWIPLALPDQVRSVFPKAQVIALGGATEATVWSNSYPVGEVAEEWVSIPYGRPIQNARYHVLGHGLEPCPVRLAGDLYIGGECLAAGYAQEPVLTAEKFVPDPWSETEGGRLYRTGDRARFWEDGLIEFLGRLDHQVKIRGFRIELGEIEAVLTEDPRVDDAVVLVREDLPAGRGLVAYVNAPGGDVSEEGLRQQLGERLPEYMVPSFLLVLPSLPLTSNGKVDRKALLTMPLPVPGRETSGDPTSQPLTPTEARLAEIWREVLRLDGPVGSADNFFELGGDSILTIQLVSRAREAGLELSPRLIFTHPTLGELAGALGTVAGRDQRQIIGTEPAVGDVALTPIQHWFFNRLKLEDEPWHWNQTLLLTVRRRLARPVIEQALTVLLEQHDMLRARFEQRNGAWHQHIAAWHQHIATTESRAPLHEIDLRALPESHRTAALEAAGEQVQSSLDLAAGPLLRLAIFRGLADEASDRLLWAIHHLAIDAVSWRILLGDFEAAVRRLEAGEAPVPTSRTTSYQAWSAALGQRLEDTDSSEATQAWQSLPWHEATPPPFDQQADDDREAGARTLTVDLGADATEALLQRSNRARGTSIEDLLLAALLRAWGKWTGHCGLHLDLEGHGRDAIDDRIDLSHTVGWFTALDPVLLSAVVDASPEHTLQAVHQQLDAMRQRPSFGLLRYLADGARLPDAPVLFNYLGRLDSALPADSLLALAPESPGAAHSPRARRRHPLELSASVLGGTLRLEIRYPGLRLQRASIETLVDAWHQSLLAYAETPAAIAALTDFPDIVADEAKLGQVLGEWEDQGSRVEALLPLSPSQEGMLFHSLLDPQAGAYLGQVHLLLRGELTPAAFTRAWQGLLQRHAVLRTGFAWRELDRPLQGVLSEVELPLETLDWRQMPAMAQAERWQELLAEDRRQGFDFAQAPLMRLALIRLDESTYRLLWTYHHTILDGWSLATLFEDLFALYHAAVQGTEARLPDRRPWADYLHWLAWQDLGPAEAHWRRRLAGFHQPTALGIERTATAGGEATEADTSPSRRTERRQLPRDLSQQLDALAKRSDSTLNTLVHAAWALLLGRLGGTRDVVFGSVVSGRPPGLRGVESIVGLFITTLPCRVGLANRHVAPWLAELRDDLLELRDYEHTPPVAIQGWSEVDSGSDLFDSLVVFENYPIAGVAHKAAGLKVLDTGAIERSHYALSLQVVPEDSGILLLLHHDADRFEPTAARRLIGHAEQLLAGLVGDGERRLDDLAMLSPAQTAQLTREWNDTSVVSNDPSVVSNDSSVVSASAQPVHRLISQQAQATPDAVAVVFGGQSLSYRELDRRASHFGHRLRALGVGRDETVGLAMERSLELPTAVLGILHAGAGYLPLDPDDPAERREYILADAGVAVLVASGAETANVPTAYRRIDFATESQPVAELAASSVDRVDDDGAAYLIYTSGSTGRPKGTVNVHRAVRNQVEWLQSRYPIGPTDRVLQKTPISFDVSVWELFWPLSVGACLVMARPGGHRDPAYLARTIGRHRITTTHFVPSMLQLFLEEPDIEAHAPTLRQVVASGEALPLDLERRFFERLSVPLPNMYGPSEAARSSFYDCSPADSLPVVPIGRPTSNTALHIADRLLRQAPLGASGELLIGGAQLARGYHWRPGLTALKFVPDPFGDAPGARLYRSGDRVGFAPDGRIEFLGRIDHQVKVRGVRVEPGEIEAILQQHSGVREAVVVTPGAGAQLRLCAFIVPTTEATQTIEGLRSFLEDRLPLAAVPSHFEVLDELPLLPSGKADRVALTRRAESAGAGLAEGQHQAPRTPTEELLAGIWSDVLGLEPGSFGIADDFFALGGHSLLATRVASRLRGAFDVELPLRTLFEASTVAELAREVEATRAGALAAPPIEPRREPMPETGWPASFAQERLWFLDQLDPGTPVFNLPSAIRLRGRLDTGALRAAFADLGRRHETLRTAFADAGGRPVQVIDETFTAAIHSIDLSALPEPEAEALARHLMRREALRPFDLRRAPLVRATLLHRTAGPEAEHLLLLTLHHVISDGWSSAVLVREIGALYAGHAAGRPVDLPPLPVQYADFARWQRGWLAGEVLQGEIDFWRRRLEGAPAALELPTDRPRPAVFDHRGGSVHQQLDADATQRLHDLARGHGATLFMVLSAGFMALLRRLSGQDDLVVGTPIANRNRAEAEGLIGFFVNSLVLRPDLPGDPTFAELLERTRHTALEAYEHQDLPFEKLVEALQPERDPSRPPIIQAALVLQNAAPDHLELPDLVIEPVLEERRQVQLELEMEVVEGVYFGQGDGLTLRLAYATCLFDATHVRRTLHQLTHLLRSAVVDPSQRLSQLTLSSAAERHQVLIEWNASSAAERQDVIRQDGLRQDGLVLDL
ncbi:MAG: amino acid adenylation domain-containing protein, partial [Acidobacteriota bacterium]